MKILNLKTVVHNYEPTLFTILLLKNIIANKFFFFIKNISFMAASNKLLPKTPTGIAGLDEITGGGFPTGTYS